jgi:hypothetical protein
MVLDRDSLNLGPAYFFGDYYDKIVIVPEHSFPFKDKRSISSDEILARSNMNSYTKSLAQEGDKPWFCVWNSTVFEFFIYVTQNTSGSQQSAAASSAASSSSPRGAIMISYSTITPASTSPSTPTPISISSNTVAAYVGTTASTNTAPTNYGH